MARQTLGMICIFEEDIDWGKFATRTLQIAEQPCAVSSDLENFISLIKQEAPILIVMGVSVIGARELEIFNTILQAANATPIIVVASSLTRSAMRNAFLRGAADVARKSFDAQDFLELIQAHLNSMNAPEHAVAKARESEHD